MFDDDSDREGVVAIQTVAEVSSDAHRHFPAPKAYPMDRGSTDSTTSLGRANTEGFVVSADFSMEEESPSLKNSFAGTQATRVQPANPPQPSYRHAAKTVTPALSSTAKPFTPTVNTPTGNTATKGMPVLAGGKLQPANPPAGNGCTSWTKAEYHRPTTQKAFNVPAQEPRAVSVGLPLPLPLPGYSTMPFGRPPVFTGPTMTPPTFFSPPPPLFVAPGAFAQPPPPPQIPAPAKESSGTQTKTSSSTSRKAATNNSSIRDKLNVVRAQRYITSSSTTDVHRRALLQALLCSCSEALEIGKAMYHQKVDLESGHHQ